MYPKPSKKVSLTKLLSIPYVKSLIIVLGVIVALLVGFTTLYAENTSTIASNGWKQRAKEQVNATPIVAQTPVQATLLDN